MITQKPILENKVDILIQGAGIGGLALAVGLKRCGYSVKLVEKASELSEVGAGIWMAPNALQVFKNFGLADEIRKQSWPIHNVILTDYRGKDLSLLQMEPLKNEFGFYIQAIHRGRLQSILCESVGIENIFFDREIESWTENKDDLRILLSGGEEIRAQILIGADGLNSKIRSKLFPDSQTRYSGSSSFRAIVHTPEQLQLDPHSSREVWAPGCRFGFSPISKEKTYWYLTFDAKPGEKQLPSQNKQRALSLAKEFFPQYANLVENAQDNSVIRTDISDLKPLDKWCEGRIALMGDAAHATTPNLGQGGAQAVEDAFALMREIERHGLNPKALSEFFLSRKEKANWIVQTSWSYGNLSHLRNPILRYLRNGILSAIPDSVSVKQLRRIYRLK